MRVEVKQVLSSELLISVDFAKELELEELEAFGGAVRSSVGILHLLYYSDSTI